MRLAWLKEIVKFDRRNKTRRGMPGVVAYYWDGSSSRAHEVLNVSTSGSYMLTDERWYPDTILKIILRRAPGGMADCSSAETKDDAGAICVLGRIVRAGPDGVGLQFVFPEDDQLADKSRYPECASDRGQLSRFLECPEGALKGGVLTSN
jgi:hypothetical protein